MRYNVEVDQSVKIEDSGPTVLAFSDGIAFAIVIPAYVKRDGIKVLRDRGKKKSVACRLLFAACLYLLLEEYLDQIGRVTIDTECTGHEADIRAFLLRHVWRKASTFEEWRIEFRQVGKRSPAHKKAERVRKGRDKGYRRVALEEVLNLIQ